MEASINRALSPEKRIHPNAMKWTVVLKACLSQVRPVMMYILCFASLELGMLWKTQMATWGLTGWARNPGCMTCNSSPGSIS